MYSAFQFFLVERFIGCNITIEELMQANKYINKVRTRITHRFPPRQSCFWKLLIKLLNNYLVD